MSFYFKMVVSKLNFILFKDSISIKASATDTNSTYSLMQSTRAVNSHAPSHNHGTYEETLYVIEGSLEFILGQSTQTITTNDFIKNPRYSKSWV